MTIDPNKTYRRTLTGEEIEDLIEAIKHKAVSNIVVEYEAVNCWDVRLLDFKDLDKAIKLHNDIRESANRLIEILQSGSKRGRKPKSNVPLDEEPDDERDYGEPDTEIHPPRPESKQNEPELPETL